VRNDVRSYSTNPKDSDFFISPIVRGPQLTTTSSR